MRMRMRPALKSGGTPGTRDMTTQAHLFDWLSALLACLGFALAPLAQAQPYPSRPLRLTSPA